MDVSAGANREQKPLPTLLRDAKRGTGDFEKATHNGWSLTWLRTLPLRREDLPTEPLPTGEAWRDVFDTLLCQTELAEPGDAWPRFKSDEAAVVAAGRVESVDIVVKRPRRTRTHKLAVDLLRTGRARRSWIKTWQLLSLGLPTEVPVLVAE
ncbi:MAG: hypothetical protein AAGK78_16210, partial [Planctomycetota bacterium]